MLSLVSVHAALSVFSEKELCVFVCNKSFKVLSPLKAPVSLLTCTDDFRLASNNVM